MSLLAQWAVVVTLCTVAVLLFVCVAGIVSDYRELKRKNAPSPLTIIIKGLSPFPIFIYDKFAGRQLKTSDLNEFINKTIWVDWDIRWVAADSTQGKILEVISNSTGDGLLIRLRYPIIDTTENVIFYPRKISMSSSRFRYSSVSGKILPTYKQEDYENTHGSISSTLTVL